MAAAGAGPGPAWTPVDGRAGSAGRERRGDQGPWGAPSGMSPPGSSAGAVSSDGQGRPGPDGSAAWPAAAAAGAAAPGAPSVRWGSAAGRPGTRSAVSCRCSAAAGGCSAGPRTARPHPDRGGGREGAAAGPGAGRTASPVCWARPVAPGAIVGGHRGRVARTPGRSAATSRRRGAEMTDPGRRRSRPTTRKAARTRTSWPTGYPTSPRSRMAERPVSGGSLDGRRRVGQENGSSG